MHYPIIRLAQVLADGPRSLVCVMDSIRKQMPAEETAVETAN
jgi:hypothetical protein